MSGITEKVSQIYSFEEYAARDLEVNRINPIVKIGLVFLFICVIVSFSRYQFFELVPYIFFPMILLAVAELPAGMFLKRTSIVIPFCLFAGISNVIIEQSPAFMIGSFNVSFGLLSLVTIIFKAMLCVAAVLFLVGTTPFTQLSAALRRMHIPQIVITLFEMTYRYIGTLAEETSNMYTAYLLRSQRAKGIRMKDMGSFVGQLLIRSSDRAERVYAAMKLRGYGMSGGGASAGLTRGSALKMTGRDWAILFIMAALILLPRFVSIPALYMQFVERFF
jgi:cobalt/nickel transport system permease protein